MTSLRDLRETATKVLGEEMGAVSEFDPDNFRKAVEELSGELKVNSPSIDMKGDGLVLKCKDDEESKVLASALRSKGMPCEVVGANVALTLEAATPIRSLTPAMVNRASMVVAGTIRRQVLHDLEFVGIRKDVAEKMANDLGGYADSYIKKNLPTSYSETVAKS